MSSKISIYRTLILGIFFAIFFTSYASSGELGEGNLRPKNKLEDIIPKTKLSDKKFLTTSSIGGVGIMETPTGRFKDDGTMTIGMSSAVPFNRSYFVIQALPNVEVTIKYNQIDVHTDNPIDRWVKWFRFTGGSYTGRDKSFYLRFK